jgi:hypothetical protein
MADRITNDLRRLVFTRARDACEYCRSLLRFSMQPFAVEHVLPTVRGGSSHGDNLALSCQGCNNHKYTKTHGRDPVSGALVPLFHPRHQRWRDHFAWGEDASLIIGLSAQGRATVDALALNRPGLVALRRLLGAAGEHPPPEPDEG